MSLLMVRFSGPLSGPPGDIVFAPTMRHRPTTRKSVPFSDTEIGVGFRDKRYRFWTQINATRRHRNRCRVTWSLVLNLNQIRCRFATPKSVSFCGAFGTTFEYNSVSFYGARGPRARVQVPLRAGRFCRVEIVHPKV